MRRLFVAEPEPERVYFMINPVILETEGSVVDQEGCLSVPGLVGTVERPERIRMKALDLDGQEKEYEFEGFDARVMCHEYDHLEGILYTDKATDIHDPMDDLEEEGAEATE
jgi:peptide deformylase